MRDQYPNPNPHPNPNPNPNPNPDMLPLAVRACGFQLGHAVKDLIGATLLALTVDISDEELRAAGLDRLVQCRQQGEPLQNKNVSYFFPRKKGGTTSYTLRPDLLALFTTHQLAWPGLRAPPATMQFLKNKYDARSAIARSTQQMGVRVRFKQGTIKTE